MAKDVEDRKEVVAGEELSDTAFVDASPVEVGVLLAALRAFAYLREATTKGPRRT